MNDLATSSPSPRVAAPFARAFGVTAALGLLVAAPLFVGQYGMSVAFNLFQSIALAESWLLVSGLTGYISLGHAVFVGLGSYVMAVCFAFMPFWAVIPLGGVAAGALALVLGYPALRVRGPYFVILTFGIAELGQIRRRDDRECGRKFRTHPDRRPGYQRPLRTHVRNRCPVVRAGLDRTALALRSCLESIREDETAAETIGINVRLAKVSAFALSGIIPGMVGAVMAMRSAYFEPMVAFSPMVSFAIVTTAMIGGSDTPLGPLLGAVLLVGASELLQAQAPEIYQIILGVVLVVFVLRVPEGIHGRMVSWIKRRERLRR
jgi:branched-chain amino acid transport system permease protein